MPRQPNKDPEKAPPKVRCPVTREEFRDEAAPLKLTIAGRDILLGLKEFSTGSLGWWGNEKIVAKVGDKEVKCQASLSITIVGSKELPQ